MEMTCGGEGNAPPRIEGGINIRKMNENYLSDKINLPAVSGEEYNEKVRKLDKLRKKNK